MTDCKWMKDEICVNADCPMRADYCPVPDTEGVCKFEDRTTDSVANTDKERLVELLSDIDRHLVILGRSCNIGNPFGIIADHLIANGVVVQKQGEWEYEFNLDGSNFYRCSVCERQEVLLEKEDIYEFCPYCHCGAKMVKEDK